MHRPTISLLGYSLLGLIHQQPRSGYDLRMIFARTPMAVFSGSPGAIYPALRRLAIQKLVVGSVMRSSGLRRRQVFRLTPRGSAELKAWLSRPITDDDVVHSLDELMLRFAYTDATLGRNAAMKFLKSLSEALAVYLPTLTKYFKIHAAQMPLSGQLALQRGVESYEAMLDWSRRALARYRKERSKQG